MDGNYGGLILVFVLWFYVLLSLRIFAARQKPEAGLVYNAALFLLSFLWPVMVLRAFLRVMYLLIRFGKLR